MPLGQLLILLITDMVILIKTSTPTRTRDTTATTVTGRDFITDTIHRIKPTIIHVSARGAVAHRADSPFVSSPFLQSFFNNFPHRPRRRLLQNRNSKFVVSNANGVLAGTRIIGKTSQMIIALGSNHDFRTMIRKISRIASLTVMGVSSASSSTLPMTALNSSSRVRINS